MRFRKCFGLLLALTLLAVLTGCDFGNGTHEHTFTKWTVTKAATCVDEGVQSRECQECGYMESEKVMAIGHSTVKDAVVNATCTADGLTEGSHCGICNEVFVAQQTIPAYGHAPLVDYPVSAGCSSEGLTEGSHCGLCGDVIVAQETVPALGHQYDIVSVVMEAHCSQVGIKKYSCTRCDSSYVETFTSDEHSPETDPYVAPGCESAGLTEGSHCEYCGVVLQEQEIISAIGHSYGDGAVVREATCILDGVMRYSCTACDHYYEEAFAKQQYTAAEIYLTARNYVCQVHSYDKAGQEYAAGAGIIYTSDGQILINYHVIDGARSAEVIIDGVTYPVVSVLAYDAKMDIAIVKIEASDLSAATFCANPVTVGSAVYAIGVSETYTQGVIISTNRVLDGKVFIHHDAAITSANSGAPLINIYGEVIAVSTVTVSNAQSQSLAVFTAELSNLVYGEPLTVEEFYMLECASTYEKLQDYILSSGTVQDNGDYIITQTIGEKPGSVTYTLHYSVETGRISLSSYGISTIGFVTYVELDLFGDLSALAYNASYGTESGWYNHASGTLDAAAFRNGTSLTCDSYVGLDSVKPELLLQYGNAVNEALVWLSEYFVTNSVGFTVADLGFVHYT